MKVLNNTKGYTLTEMMVVVAIIGVLAAMAVPTYLSYLPHLRLNSSARDIISYVRTARAQAATKGRNVQLNFILNNYPVSDIFQILDSVAGRQISSPVTTSLNVDINDVLFSGGNDRTAGDSSTSAWGTDQIFFTSLGSVITSAGNSANISIFVCSVSPSGNGCGAGGSLEQLRIDINGFTGNSKVCSGWSNPCP